MTFMEDEGDQVRAEENLGIILEDALKRAKNNELAYLGLEIEQIVNIKINFTIHFGPHAAEIEQIVIIKSTLRSTLRPILGLPLQK